MRSCWRPLLVVAVCGAAAALEAEDASPQVDTANVQARLHERLAEFDALKAEIAELEELAGVPPQLYVVRVQLIELSLTKQRNSGVPIVSLDSPGDAATNATIVAEWITNQFAKVRVDQTLTSVDGRRASTYIAGSKARRSDAQPVERTLSEPPPDLPTIDASRIDFIPALRPDGKVQVTIDFCRGELASVGGSEASRESAPDRLKQRWQSSIEMVPGQSVVAARSNKSLITAQSRGIAFGFFREPHYSVNEIQTLLLVTLEPQK